jgi:hypothetical protein
MKNTTDIIEAAYRMRGLHVNISVCNCIKSCVCNSISISHNITIRI